MSINQCPCCGHKVDEAYKAFRKDYKAQWYQSRKKEMNYNSWIRDNPKLKDVEGIKELYLKHGGVKAKKMIKNKQ